MITAITAIVLLAAAAWILRPLMRPAAHFTEVDEDFERLSVQKQAVLRSILDLELDKRLGKVEEAEYAALRKQLDVEAIQLLAELDRSGKRDLEDLLEDEIRAARQRLAPRG